MRSVFCFFWSDSWILKRELESFSDRFQTRQDRPDARFARILASLFPLDPSLGCTGSLTLPAFTHNNPCKDCPRCETSKRFSRQNQSCLEHGIFFRTGTVE
jgi:hypothetical protein